MKSGHAVGEPSGHLVDDFTTIPTSDPTLDEIRERFLELIEGYPLWEPQMPFPEKGLTPSANSLRGLRQKLLIMVVPRKCEATVPDASQPCTNRMPHEDAEVSARSRISSARNPVRHADLNPNAL